MAEPMAGALPCPCGEVHELSAATRVAYENVTAGLPPDVIIAVPEGAWHVPRIFLAVHGVKASDLPALAARYGFAPARTCDCPAADGYCPHCGQQKSQDHKDRCHRAATGGD